jgi:hypothetical protein
MTWHSAEMRGTIIDCTGRVEKHDIGNYVWGGVFPQGGLQ